MLFGSFLAVTAKWLFFFFAGHGHIDDTGGYSSSRSRLSSIFNDRNLTPNNFRRGGRHFY